MNGIHACPLAHSSKWQLYACVCARGVQCTACSGVTGTCGRAPTHHHYLLEHHDNNNPTTTPRVRSFHHPHPRHHHRHHRRHRRHHRRHHHYHRRRRHHRRGLVQQHQRLRLRRLHRRRLHHRHLLCHVLGRQQLRLKARKPPKIPSRSLLNGQFTSWRLITLQLPCAPLVRCYLTTR